MRKYRRLKLSYAEKALQKRREYNLRRFKQISFIMLAGLLGFIQPAFASPEVDHVANGEVYFSQNDKLTEITASNNSIINYKTFNIAHDETVRFIQPSENSRVLNRVLSEDPSTIAGQLLANGQVYIVNPAGIYFTEGSLVDVGELYAAAGNMLDHEFLAGQDDFHELSGQVINDGTIMADTVALVGRYVANNGEIISQDGLITLAVGDEVYLSRVGSHVMVKVADISDTLASETDGISNSGSINAGDGSISMVSSDMIGLAMGISSRGDLKASDITLDSGANGLTEVTGSLNADNSENVGGSIKVLGDKVALIGAELSASGKSGGGEILIGGDYQGNGEVRNASRTYIDSDTDIVADALENGDGGKVICWSDEITAFLGDIFVRGGNQSGDGGFVEVSGKENLLFQGYVDAAAENGTDGHLLLDPRDVDIVNGNSFVFNVDNSEITDLSILFNESIGTDFSIGEAYLESLGDVSLTIQAERHFTINNLTDNVLSFGATGGNTVTLVTDADGDGGDFAMIDTNDTIQTAGGNIVVTTGSSQFTGGSFNSNGGNIDLDADGSISVNQITTNGGDLTVVADENYTAGGDFTASGTISTNTGDVSIDGVNINLVTLTTAGGNVTLTPEEIAITTSINTGAGNLAIYPRVASHMDIGNGTTGLDISDTELGRITCSGIFRLGDATNTSSMDLDSITDHAGISGAMRFYSDGDIEIVNMSSPTITTPTVSLYADDGVSINSILTLGQDAIINADNDSDGVGTFYVDTTGDQLDTSAANANITITAANLDFGDESASRIDAGSGNITLIASNNRTMGINTGDFNVSDAEMDRIDTTGILTFDTSSTFTVNENMTCQQSTSIFAGGGVTQNNLIDVTGNLSVTADVANSNIVLTNASNSVTGTVSLNTLGTGDASWTENGNIDFAASSVAGDLIIDSNGNNITDSGAVSVGLTLAITDTNNATLDLLSGDINLAATSVTTNLDFSVATGSITQSGALTVGGTADFATTTANEVITLNNTSNNITGQVTFATAGTTGNVVFDNATNAINLGASTINGGLDIDTAGHLTVNGAVTTVGATLFTVDDITMTSTLNAGTAAITIAPDDNGTIGLGATVGDMTLSDAELDNITTSGTVTFDTNSAITVDNITPSNITGQFYMDSLATVSFINGGSTFSGNFRVGCSDIDISQTINCGANSGMISAANNKHIYLGTAAANGNIDVTGTELQNITAANLEFTTGNGENIYVNNVTAANSNNISGTITLDSAEDVIFQTNGSVFNALTVEANDGLAINDGITLQTDTGAMSLDGNLDAGAFAITTGGNVTLDSAGALTLNELTAGGDIDITATDLTLNQTVTMGTNALTISTAGNIGIGDTAGVMTLSPTEVSRLSSTTGNITIETTGGSFTVDNISAANSNNIGGILTLQASGNTQTVTFANNDSTFNTLTVNADDGIFINNVLVGTDTGNFVLDPDLDTAVDTNDKINFSGAGAGMTTATSFTVGTINVSNALTLKANDSITFTADQTVPDGVNIVADLDADGVGDFITNAGVDVNTSGNNGNINIAAADIQLNGDSLNAGTGTITFVPQKATDVSLGTDSGTFGISAAELALMTADALVVGDTSASFNSTSNQFTSVAIDGNFAAGAKTVDIQTSGTVTVSNAVSLSTTNENITISSNDLAMNATGAINAGNGTLALSTESAGNDVVLGGTGQEYNIDDTELSNITSGALTITVQADDDIYVSGVADAAAENVGNVTLVATGDNSIIIFDTASAQFDSLAASADSGITISQNITADTGNLTLEGDADNAADTNDNIAISDGITLTSSNGSVGLAATTGDIDAAGALTIDAAAGITFSDAYVAAGAGALTIDADTDTNGVGTFTAGSTITTNNSLISITAADIALNGNVNSGSGAISILPSTAAGQTIVFGAAGGDMGFTAAEVGYLNTSGLLTVGNTNTTSLTVSTDPTNATGAITLVSSDTGGTIVVDGVFTPDSTLSMTALEGITVSSNITTGSTITIDADSDDNNNGTLTVDNGVTLASTNDIISITAKDIALTGTGAIDSGSAAMNITQSQAAGTIGLGGSAATMQITDAELDNITAANFTIYAPSDVTINGVTADTGNSIDGTFLVDAAGKVTFATANSDFKTLEIQADDGIEVNTVIVSTDTGSITMDGNVDNSADASDTIAFVGVAGLDSKTTLSLTSTNDGLTSAAATTITAVGRVTISDAFVASAALDITSSDDDILFSDDFTGGGITNFKADDDITLNGDVSLGGTTLFDADVDNGDNDGTFTIAGAKTITTNNNALTISADDIDLAGSIAGGAGLLTLDVSDGGTIGLAAASANMTISTAELARITGQSGGLTVSGSSGVVTVNAMDVDANITGMTTIDATNDNASVVFTGSNSEFAGLTVNADSGIDIAVNLTAKNGNMVLEGDADNAADTNDDIDLTGNRILTATGGSLTLGATTGKIDDDGTLTLRGDDGITINDNLTTAGLLTIDADRDDDATGTLTVAGVVSSSDNKIDIIADDMNVTGSISSGTNNLWITPSTAISIGLGTGAGNLSLSAAEINSLTCNDLYLGDGVGTDLAVNTITTAGINGDIYIDITGDMSIAGGQWNASSDNSNFDIICNDINFSADLNSGSGSIRVRTSDGGGIGLGTAAQGMTLANTDLVRFLTSGGLTLETQAGENIEISGVTTGNTNNITGTLTFDADTNGSQVNFTNTASALRNNVIVRADDGVDIDVNLTVENGSLSIDGDTDGAADGRDYIAMANGVTVTAAGGTMTLAATNGDLIADGALTLTSSGKMTISDDLTTNNGASTDLDLIINASDLDFNGSALNADAGDITIRPSSASNMGLGATATGAFDFTDAEFDKITTSGVVTFGGTYSADVTVDNFTAPASVTGEVVIISGQNNGSVTFANNASSFRDALTIQALDDISINQNVTTGGIITIDADTDGADNDGTLTVAAGITIDSTDTDIDITADDFVIGAGSTIDAGTADMSITDSDGSGIGLGATAVANGLNVTDAELGEIIANNLEFVTSGNMTVDNITAASSNNIANTLTLDSAGNIEFANNASTFNELVAEADGLIQVNADITTDNDVLNLYGDTNGNAGGVASILFAAGTQIDSNTTIILDATSSATVTDSSITGAGALDIIADNGITVENSISAGGTLTIDADEDLDTTGNFTIAAGASVNATGNDVDITANTVTFGAGALTNVADLALSATVNSDLTVNGDFDNSGSVTLRSVNKTITINSDISSDKSITLIAKEGITINNNITADADTDNAGGESIVINADSNGDGTGDLTVKTAGKSIVTNNNDLTITANDLDMQNDYAFDAGTGKVTITESQGTGIGLGDTPVATGLNVSTGELVRITAAETEFITSGNVLIDNISAASSNNIDLLVIDNQGQSRFINNASTFDALTVESDDGINIDVNITTDTGALSLDGDADVAADTSDDIAIAAGLTLQAQTNMTLAAQTGKITAAGTLDLLSESDITINDNLTVADDLTINTDGITVNNDATGDLTIAADTTISTQAVNKQINITANDIFLNGYLNAGTSTITASVSDNQDYIIGTGTVEDGSNNDFNITATELAHITAGTLELNTNGDTEINDISAANSNNVGLLVVDIAGQARFLGTASTFNALTVESDDGIDIDVNITTDTGNLSLEGDADNLADTNDDIAIAAGLTLQAQTNMILNATTGKITAAGTLDLLSESDITIYDNLTAADDLTINTDGITVDNDGTGNLTVAGGTTISTEAANKQIIITANDLALSGFLRSGAGKITITESEGAGIGFGGSTVPTGLNVANAELVNITSAETEFVTSGNVLINGVDNASSNNIDLLVIDNQGQCNFLTVASTFNALTVESDDGIDIAIGITTDTGALSLDGDADIAADTNDNIDIVAGITLQAQTNLTLAAQTGKISAAGTLNLKSESDITINDDLTAADTITIDTDGITIDNDGTGDFIVAADATISTEAADKEISVMANDMFLNGYVRSGTSDNIKFIITISDNQDFYLGSNAVENGSNNGFNINSTELSHIYASNLELITSGDVDISNILAGAADNVTYMVTFNIAGHATFSNDCIFNSITINANDGIEIGGNLTSQLGDIILDGDSNTADDGNGYDDIRFAANSSIISAGKLDLKAENGELNGLGALVLSAAQGVEIHHNLSTNGDLTINADNDLDGVGPLTSHGTFTCNNNNLDLTGANVDIFSGITNTVDLSITSTAGDLNITGAVSFNNTGDLSITVPNGSCEIDKVLNTLGAITISAGNGVDIKQNITGQGDIIINADNDADAVGDLSVLTGVQIVSNNGAIEITASDIAELAGTLNSGVYVTKIDSTSLGIGVGSTSGSGLNISNQELANITAQTLEFVTSSDITVSGVQNSANNNIGTVILDAGGKVIFQGSESIFNILDVQAENGIDINADVTTDTGELFFNNDTSFLSGGNNGINFGDDVTVTSAEGLTIGGSGDLTADGDVYLVADGDITILSDFNIASGLNVNTNNNVFNIDGVDITVSADGPVNINSGDIDMTGSLSSLLGLITIVPDSDTVGLGNGSGSLSLSNNELASITADKLLIDAAGKITVSNVSTDSTSNIVTLELDSQDYVTFDSVVVDSNLNVYSSAGITQTGSLTVSGDSILQTNVDDKLITLDNSQNSLIGSITILTQSSGNSAADVILNNGNTAVVLADSSIAGDLTLDTNNAVSLSQLIIDNNFVLYADGSVSQSAALNVGGNLTLTQDLAESDVTLNDTNNSILGTVAFYTASDSNVSYYDGSNEIEILEADIGGGMTLVASGSVTDQLSVNVAGITIIKTLSNDGADIILDNNSNTFGALDLYCRNSADSTDAAGNIIIYENDDTIIEKISTAGNLNLTTAGNITENTSMAIGGAVTINTLSDTGGDISLTGENTFGQIDIDVLNVNGSTYSNGNVQIRENETIEIASIETGGQIHLTSDDFALTGNLTGSSLAIVPLNSSTSIGIGDGATGNMKFSTAEIANFTDGFNSITIGRSNMTGNIIVQDVTFTDPVSIYTSGTADIKGTITGSDDSSVLVNAADGMIIRENIVTAGNNISLTGGFNFTGSNTLSCGATAGAIVLDGDAQTKDGISIIAPDGITLNGEFNNDGDGEMLYGGSILLADNVTINADTADVTVTGIIDGQYDLNVNSVDGDITFGSDMGTSQELANLTVITSEEGTIEFNSEINVLGNIFLSSSQSLGIIPSEATIFKKSEGDLVFNAGGKFEVGLNNRITVSGGSLVITTNSDVVSIGDATVKENIIVNSMDSSGDIILLLRDKTESYVISNNGTIKLLKDKGMAIAAEGYIEFNGQIVPQGDGSKPYFVTGNKKESDGLTGYKVYTIKEIEELIGQDEDGNEVVVVYIPVSEGRQIVVDPITAALLRNRDDIYHDRQIASDIYYASREGIAIDTEHDIHDLAKAWFTE